MGSAPRHRNLKRYHGETEGANGGDFYTAIPILLTVLIPCFNEAAILEQTVAELRSYLETKNWRQGQEGSWEILFVDDGSSDATASILLRLAQNNPQIRFISYPMNLGQGQALRKGFDGARGKWIFCVDADLDYGPEHIEQFLGIANSRGAKIVIGSPYMRAVRRIAFHSFDSI